MATTTGIKRQQTMADPQRLRRTLFIARRTYYTHYAHFPFERYDDKKPDVNSWEKIVGFGIQYRFVSNMLNCIYDHNIYLLLANFDSHRITKRFITGCDSRSLYFFCRPLVTF